MRSYILSEPIHLANVDIVEASKRKGYRINREGECSYSSEC